MKKKKAQLAVLTAGFIAALILVAYPLAANIYNAIAQKRLIAGYSENVSEITQEDCKELIQAAKKWNEALGSSEALYALSGDMSTEEFYESLLNVNGDGMMGYVIIPSIGTELAVYHYATEEVLSKGAGHLESSSLPVGGEGTHCVITAHRGLPTAEMFTDLDQVETGDVFYLRVLGETLCYEVISISEVDPDDTQQLLPVEGKDLCTLVTCTPYGINTRRLLVTGIRTEMTEDEADEAADAISEESKVALTDTTLILAIAALAELSAYAVMLRYIISKKEKGSEEVA